MVFILLLMKHLISDVCSQNSNKLVKIIFFYEVKRHLSSQMYKQKSKNNKLRSGIWSFIKNPK